MIDASAVWGEWGSDVSSLTASGIRVTPTSSMQLLAVYGSVQLITNEISTLPRDFTGVEPDWLTDPTPDLNWIAWCGQVLMSWLLQGELYLFLMYSGVELIAAIPLDPAKCSVRREQGRKVVCVNGIRNDNVVHFPALMMPGSDRGLSPVEMARQSIGLGLAAQEFGAKQFDGDLNMPGVIEMEKQAQPDTKKAMASMWRRNRSRAGRGLPGILDDGAKWKATGITNEQAQFLETRQFTAAEIAGQMFLLDPSDLGIAVQGTSLTYANLAQRNTRRVQVTLMPWIRRLELVVTSLTRGTFKLNVDARLRGDTRESYETLGVALDHDFMNIAEVREILNLDPLAPSKPPTFTEKVDMVGQLIRAGFQAEAACVAVGLPQIPHTGLNPVTVTPPRTPAVATPGGEP